MTASKGDQTVQDSTLAKRYAAALADLAAGQGLLEQVGQELADFRRTLDAAPSFRQLLTSPAVGDKDQQTALGSYLEHAEPSAITGNFLRLLTSKRRMRVIDAIAQAFAKDVQTRSGQVTVQVSATVPLTEETQEQLRTTLAGVTGKQVTLEVSQDPNLLGGLVLRVGSVMLDYSIRSRLSRLKATMKG